MDIHYIFTAFALVFCLVGVGAAVHVLRTADRVDDMLRDVTRVAQKLASERARVTVCENEGDALRKQLQTLRGAFYSFKAKVEEDMPLEDDLERLGYGDGNVDQRSFALAGSICDNWSIAQRDGPRSDAASCECSYCVGRRAERRALRAALVPKTVQGQAEVARINAGKP